MSEVIEHIDAFPFDAPARVLRRREELLLAEPLPGRMRQNREHPPIEAVHFGAEYVDQPFVPPRGVYESAFIRVEWQTMDARQPFYHRNCGVDELSYQVCGDRTVMTELGSADLVPGEFVLLPDGIAHDNYGRRDIHLLFYIPSPLTRLHPVHRQSEPKIPPFPGWTGAILNELVTEGLAGPGQDVGLAPMDEALLLAHAHEDSQRLEVLRPGTGSAWLYRGEHVMLGQVAAAASMGRAYRRHRNAEEIQYQVSGTRTLVTQRGVLHLEPGDFVRIPLGVAFTSIHHQPSTHLALVSRQPTPQVAATARRGARLTADEVERLRQPA